MILCNVIFTKGVHLSNGVQPAGKGVTSSCVKCRSDNYEKVNVHLYYTRE